MVNTLCNEDAHEYIEVTQTTTSINGESKWLQCKWCGKIKLPESSTTPSISNTVTNTEK